MENQWLQAAEPWLSRLKLALRIEDWQTDRTLGNFRLEPERYEEAETYCRKAIAIEGDRLDSYRNLGRALFQQQKWQATEQAYRKALSCWGKGSVFRYRQLGAKLAQQQRWLEAVKTYLQSEELVGDIPAREGLKEQSDTWETYLKLYDRLAKQQWWIGAIAITLVMTTPTTKPCDRACANTTPPTTNDSKTAWDVNFLGCNRSTRCPVYPIVMKRSHLLARLNATRQLLQQGIWPWKRDRTADEWENLALRLLEGDRQDAAFAAFDRAARTQPQREWLGLFQLWRIVQQHRNDPHFPWGDILISTFRQLAERYPQDRACALNLAEALSRTGNFEAARPWYRRACENRLHCDRPDLARLPRHQSSPPHFTIIGVMKGGTTALSEYLSHHPQIFPAARKEIDFWSWKYPRGLEWYLAHFPELPADGRYLTGDASPTYFQHRQAPQRLFQTYPEMKLVVLLRDPVDRTISHYHHARRHHVEMRPIPDALRSHRQIFERGENEPDKLNNYFASSLYVFPLQRWLQYFPRQQIYIIFSEDLFTNPQSTFDRLCEFLDIPPYPISISKNPNPGGYGAIDPQLRRELARFFDPYNQQLADLLQRPIPFASSRLRS